MNIGGLYRFLFMLLASHISPIAWDGLFKGSGSFCSMVSNPSLIRWPSAKFLAYFSKMKLFASDVPAPSRTWTTHSPLSRPIVTLRGTLKWILATPSPSEKLGRKHLGGSSGRRRPEQWPTIRLP
jgi:hypothetical protein